MRATWLGLVLVSCAGAPGLDTAGPSPRAADAAGAPLGDDSGREPSEEASPTARSVEVRVTLDGAPLAGVPVTQPGSDVAAVTDAAGAATLELDLSVGTPAVAVSHPEARIGGLELYERHFESGVDIDLARYETGDNPLYIFQDPGTPERNDNTNYCSHCHVTINADWMDSVHRTAASNPVLHDVYAGTADAYADPAVCEARGGTWATGIGPGTAAAAERCYLGAGTLPDLNPDCGAASPCDGVAEQTGACADCHAPGIDGELGGRDLLDAVGLSHDYGVHCDVCHKVESIDLESPEPGVAGRLRILRPSEEGTTAGPWAPLAFGPYGDVLNPRMGSVERDHFKDATMCSGCHEYDQPVLVPGASIDPARWPEGRLPVHSTYSELVDGPLGAGVPCQSCHMPPDPDAGNSADLGNVFDLEGGVAAGWMRHPGAVRRHVWFGPRHPEQRMLELAATVQLETRTEADALIVEATVTNSGPGHAIPTGEPLRSMVLVVEARCGSVRLPAVGGDAVPDVGGARDQRDAAEGWTVWPGAQPGQRLRVVSRPGGFVDYEGFGPFGDGTFSVEEKGLPVETVVGEVGIVAVAGDGTLTLDGPLPSGDRAYRVDPGDSLPAEGEAARGLAGLPGAAFARVMVDAAGNRMVPHHAAVDVVSDNRILPTRRATSTHRFALGCADPVASAVLLHRPYPLPLARERGWTMAEAVMAVGT
ncbi:MAG: hypothetical protein VX265_14485, partial [Myxococcota bacterium]|nr:hypothetical protein [Myxococcota bacterium]